MMGGPCRRDGGPPHSASSSPRRRPWASRPAPRPCPRSPAVLDPRRGKPAPPRLSVNPVPPPHGFGFPTWLYPGAGWTTCSAKRRFFVDRRGWGGLADAWTFLAGRYASNPYVIGADML